MFISLPKRSRHPQLIGAALAIMLYAPVALADPDDTGPCCHEDGHPRWYASLNGGVTFLEKTDISHPDLITQEPDDQTYKIGYGFGGALGFKIFSGIRSEVQILRAQNDVKLDTVTSATPTTSAGTEVNTTMAYMFNTYVDLYNQSNYTPYVGAGIGRAFVSDPRGYNIASTGDDTGKIAGWTTAYQFMIGVSYDFKLDDVTPASINFGYRYFTTNDVKVKFNTAAPGVTFSVPDTSSNLELGGRIYF